MKSFKQYLNEDWPWDDPTGPEFDEWWHRYQQLLRLLYAGGIMWEDVLRILRDFFPKGWGERNIPGFPAMPPMPSQILPLKPHPDDFPTKPSAIWAMPNKPTSGPDSPVG
tara:strand:+ start:424 stop:753 length:330 start_codon:yes stop_codon:yes gene_type:complete